MGDRGAIGVLCAYAPRELPEAAGFAVRRVSELSGSATDADLPPNLCAHARRSAALLAGPGAAALAGVIVTDSCFPMLRLWDHLEATAAPLPRWLLRVPRRQTPEATRFFRGELLGLADALAAAAGLERLAPERIAAEIVDRNRLRASCRQLAEGLLERGAQGLRPGQLALLAGDAGAAADEGPTAGAPEGRPRLMVVGSHFVTGGLIGLLDELGAAVCTVESCEHHRLGGGPIAVGADPLEALAAGYLALPPCPRMESGGETAERAGALADAGSIDGVLYLLPRGCTPHAYAVPRWRARLERTGVPLLAVEVEDADWSQPRLVTRLEAFLESLAGRPLR